MVALTPTGTLFATKWYQIYTGPQNGTVLKAKSCLVGYESLGLGWWRDDRDRDRESE